MTTKPPARLTDVARDAGVSIGTVSNVYNRPDRVREEVRIRVLEVADKLGYRGPDPRGRVLRAGKADAIGVVVPDDLNHFFLDPFARAFMAGIAEVCDQHGSSISLISAAAEARAARNVRNALVDGFIVHCLVDATRLVDLVRARRLPFVTVDIETDRDGHSVRTEDRAGARQAMAHLIAHGHRHIAILCMPLGRAMRSGRVRDLAVPSVRALVPRERLMGYEEALATVGLGLADTTIFETPNVPDRAAETARRLFETAPETTAVVCMSDVLAVAVIDAARRLGRRVPQDMSVIGFDDALIPHDGPPLTTVRQPIIEKGRLAAELLFADAGQPMARTVVADLIERGTTGPVPASAGAKA